jgi:hypothetical protein
MRPNGRRVAKPVEAKWPLSKGQMRPSGRQKIDQNATCTNLRVALRFGDMSLTTKQITNFHGFPKAAELIEITGTQALEASDRAIYNHMLQIAHDSGRLTEPDAEWVVTLASLRREGSRHESNDRIRDSLRRIRRTEVTIRYISPRTGKPRILETNLLTFTDTDEEDSSEATIE